MQISRFITISRTTGTITAIPRFTLNWDNCDPNTNGEKEFLRFYGKKWQIAYDIGANRGEYTKMLRQINRNCTIYCFEPNPSLKDTLRRYSNVKVFDKAVGSSNSKIHININKLDDTQSSIYRYSESTEPLSVDQICLDNFIDSRKNKRIDFIKIDTEGHELEVLKGMRRIIKNQLVDYIQFEYGGTYRDAGVTLKQAYDILEKNYIICHLCSSGLLPLSYQDSLETYRYSNWIAVSKAHG